MSTLSEEQKGFVIESLKLKVGINQIVDDLIEIYRFEVDTETREKLYRRVQKMKTKHAQDNVDTDIAAELDSESNFLASYSPQWRVAHLRQMLREAKSDDALKLRILKEIRVEEEIIRSRERKKSDPLSFFLNDLAVKDIIYMAVLSSAHQRQTFEPVRERLVQNLQRDLLIEMGMDPGELKPMTEAERVEEARQLNMTTEERFADDPYEYAIAKGWVHFGSCLPVNAYDVVEKWKVFKRRCDDVLVDDKGTPLNEGELSHQAWLTQLGVNLDTYDYTPAEGDELAVLSDKDIEEGDRRFRESLSPEAQYKWQLLDLLQAIK